MYIRRKTIDSDVLINTLFYLYKTLKNLFTIKISSQIIHIIYYIYIIYIAFINFYTLVYKP